MQTKSQYEKYSWAQDKKGERYVCVFKDQKEHSHDYEKLNDQERAHCRIVEFPWN